MKPIKHRLGATRIDALVLVGVAGIVAAVAPAGLLGARQSARRERCQNRLREIGQAMYEYADVHGGLPPRRYFSPYHGWGAIMLSHIGQQELFEEYRFDQNFYDPENRSVIRTPLALYRCPAASAGRTVDVVDMSSAETGATGAVGDYFVPNSILDRRIPRTIGNNKKTALADGRTMPLTDFPDGLSTTVLVTEQSGRPEHWIRGEKQPHNGGLTAASWWGPWASFNAFAVSGYSPDGQTMPGPCAINCNNAQGVYAFHRDGANALFADGSVRFFAEGMDIGVLYATVTRGGGEIVPATNP